MVIAFAILGGLCALLEERNEYHGLRVKPRGAYAAAAV